MSSLHNQQKTLNEEEDGLYAMQLASFSIIPMVLKAAIELDLLEIMAKAGPNAQLSPSQIASQLPTQNPEAPVILDRMLRLLASYSVLTCNLVTDKDGHNQRFYGLAPVCKYFIPNEDGISLAPFLLFIQDKVCTESSYYFKDAILEGGTPFNKAHGMRNFEYTAKDNRYHKLFNEAMYSLTSTTMKAILETYKGFEGLNKVVDVGGGLGANLRFVVSKYPKIKGINFDLPHVIKDAPPLPGVEHVGGDMFTSVPKGDAIFMKSILHDWNDDQCLKILKCCYDALPESGKIIVVESIMPEFPETDLLTKTILKYDVRMYVSNPGGKERTKEEFESLARGAGFVDTKIICRAYRYWVIEFYKNM